MSTSTQSVNSSKAEDELRLHVERLMKKSTDLEIELRNKDQDYINS